MKAVVLSLLRAQRLIGISFVCLFALLLLVMALKPRQYEAHMSFLVRNERADPLISSESHQAPLLHADISEEQINSEIELLNSAELLTAVVKDCGLDLDYRHHLFTNDAQAKAKAASKLAGNITVTPVRNASVIDVSYKSSDPNRAAAVLTSLAQHYLAERTRINSPGQALGFFSDESRLYKNELGEAESEYANFVKKNHLSLLPEQKTLNLQRLTESEQARDAAAASLAETESQIAAVRRQLHGTDQRITTQETSEANQFAVERLNTMLAELENRRTDLRVKFLPNDPLITAISQQIADTEKRLESSRDLGKHDQSSNINPLYQSLTNQLATLEQTRAGLASRLTQLDRQIGETNGELQRLEGATPQVNDLQRRLKEEEDKYTLYSGKQEEARVSNSLDRLDISNVVLVEHPVVPVLPVASRLTLLTAFLLAALLSVVIGFLSEGLSGAVHTSEDLESEPGLPVVGSVPWQAA